MKQSAIALNGSDIITIKNLKRRYNNLINNPNMLLLEECDKEELDAKQKYWHDLIRGDDPDYKFYNPKTGHHLMREKDNLDDLKEIIKDWEDYEGPTYLWA